MTPAPVVHDLWPPDAESLGDLGGAHEEVDVDLATHMNDGRSALLLGRGPLRIWLRRSTVTASIHTQQPGEALADRFDDYLNHRQTASLVADAIAEFRADICRLNSRLRHADDAYAVAAEVEDSPSLNTLRLSLAVADCLVEYDDLDMDDLLGEFIPLDWVTEARRVLRTVTDLELAAMSEGEMIADLVDLRESLRLDS